MAGARRDGTIEPFERVIDIHLADPGFWNRPDVDDAFARLRSDLPISWQEEPAGAGQPAGPGFWAVSRYADVQAVSRNPDVFSNRYGFDIRDTPPEHLHLLGMENLDDPEHRRLRRLVNAAFMPPAIQDLDQLIAEEARRVVDELLAGGEGEVVSTVSQVMPSRIICKMMGFDEDDRLGLIDLAGQTYGASAADGLQAMLDHCVRVANRKRSSPEDDLATRLVQAEIDGEGLSDQEIGAFLVLFFIGGTENTGAMMAQGLVLLSQWPDQLERWLDAVDELAPTAVEELLRFATPTVRLRRTAVVDTEVAGQPVAAGQKVVMYFNSANRDEEVFEDPDRLDLGRDPNRHIAFGGGGPHFCIGAHLSRSELRHFFMELLARVSGFEIIGGPEPVPHRDELNALASMAVRFDGVREHPHANVPTGL